MGKKTDRIGETSISSLGQMMTIIRYNNTSDIDVQFEDGTIVKNKRYKEFQTGKIRNPGRRVGETNLSTNGQKMTIIRYKNVLDIDIEFEDGAIVTHATYGSFKKGQIKNPSINIAENRVGEEKISSCGLKMIITGYNSSRNIDIQFEDGTILLNKRYDRFTRGEILHPSLSSKKKCVYKGIEALKAWNDNDKVYYKCTCTKCGEENIWTPQEMIEHEKQCQNRTTS